MIITVIISMGQFFFIFTITIITFAHTFYIYFGGLEVPDPNNAAIMDPYMPNIFNAITYTYRIALGDFDTGNLYAVPAWIFFIMATLFVQIVFLNLLISIVGETFSRV